MKIVTVTVIFTKSENELFLTALNKVVINYVLWLYVRSTESDQPAYTRSLVISDQSLC